ncbi:hypothetical protein MMC19_005989 [Ptychographa xylographoides]|nr:hypothetical protein [Ptychographa xylographoides]
MSSSTSSTKVSPPIGGIKASKLKPSKIVALRIPSTRLSVFPHEPSAGKSSASNASSSTSTPIPLKESPSTTESNPESKDVITKEETAESLQVPVETGKKKGLGGPKAGTKRPLGALTDLKPRAKPGPKKRQRMQVHPLLTTVVYTVASSNSIDGTIGPDETVRPWTTPAPIAGHKLGPKANQGAINAGLRALDRTGKPCRKWEKKGFNVKSFTGVTWHLPSWHAPKKSATGLKDEEGQSVTPTSNSENQPRQSSSNVGSENSRSAIMDSAPPASSPLPSVATPA